MTSTTAPHLLRQALQLLLWGGYAGLMLLMVHRQFGTLMSGMLLIAIGVAVGLWACSELLRWLVLRRRWLQRSGPALAARIAACLLLLPAIVQLLLYVLVTLGLRHGLIEMPDDRADYSLVSVLMYWANTVVLLGLWTGGWIAVHALRRFRQGELARLRAEAARSTLELDALRARLNPHFVFNALNNLRALINEDGERARELVTRLSNTLRHALDHGNADSVPLRGELAVVDDYLEIERVHYEQRLQVRMDISPDAFDALTPPMLLQLLVENAVKHGIACTPGGGELRVQADVVDRRLRLVVDNPGRLDSGRGGHGVGLAYLRNRLRDLPGARFVLDERDGRVRAELEIPQ